jgi:hypothetical protein
VELLHTSTQIQTVAYLTEVALGGMPATMLGDLPKASGVVHYGAVHVPRVCHPLFTLATFAAYM